MKMTNMRCLNCYYFKKNLELEHLERGVCHRYPPTVMQDYSDGYSLFIFPQVEAASFCGEYMSATDRDLVEIEE